MKPIKIVWPNWCRRLLKTSAVALLLVTLSLALSGAAWNTQQHQPILISALAKGDAITDPQALLRYALPIDNEAVRQLQDAVEDIAAQVRRKRWSSVSRDVRQASGVLATKTDQLLAGVSGDHQPQAEALIEEMKDKTLQIQEAVETKDQAQIRSKRQELLAQISDLEELMLRGFPFEIPSQYANLPQLKGRATVEIETTQGLLTLVVDGYSAPINAGNFVDLVQRGFYDGLDFIRSEDNFVLQTGDPSGADEGFIDPKTGEYRAIPMEVLVKGESQPVYGITLEDAGIYLPNLALPFNAYGAVALARPTTDANGGSSQFFFFLFDNELTPPGFNLMDGRYSVFGYVVEGQEVLGKLTDKDKIISAKVVDGLDNLVQPKTS